MACTTTMPTMARDGMDTAPLAEATLRGRVMAGVWGDRK